MNIFVTSSCPVESAKALDDKRLVKMVLETAQLLSTALFRLGYWTHDMYRPTHKDHPCTKWAMASRSNFDWLVRHGLALADEYKFRFGPTHNSRYVIERARERFKACPLDVFGMTPFANCTPYQGNAIDAYRKYMVNDKWDSSSTWRSRGKPEWS